MDGRPTVVVANTGPIVPPDAVDSLFEPFHRLNDRITGDGFGLGLAIVASIAAMHHGTVTARPRRDGGLDVAVTMPPSTTRWLDQSAQPTAASPDTGKVVGCSTCGGSYRHAWLVLHLDHLDRSAADADEPLTSQKRFPL